MDILDDMGMSKLSASFFKSELLLLTYQSMISFFTTYVAFWESLKHILVLYSFMLSVDLSQLGPQNSPFMVQKGRTALD